jgi:YD repeat-containing protein
LEGWAQPPHPLPLPISGRGGEQRDHDEGLLKLLMSIWRDKKMASRIRYGLSIIMMVIGLFLTLVINSYSETTNYIYDELNRLIRVEYADGTKIEYAYDKVGNRLAILDTRPPQGSITAPTSTSSTNIILTLSCTDNVACTEMQFSNDGSSWSDLEPYNTTTAWTLICGDGQKTVYVKFKDAAGNWSTTYQANIVLDTGCPGSPGLVKVGGNYFCTLQEAYDDSLTISGSTIKSRAITFAENLTIDNNITVTLEGGYDCNFTTNTGNTTSVKGTITTTAGAGTITIKNFRIIQ